ncbi:hypothetical protein [Aureimonas sp. ME7]|uniref:hypothetical protein n=1 Tax=Aureimonas sp. ME7 TaxID=2744252 RepID=UPI0015F6FF7B|nr:hypothetical protein [Aureimonas sp. ME7]
MTAPVTEAQWADHRRLMLNELPEVLQGSEQLPHVLLPYQQELLKATAASQLVVTDKSRRVGATWGIGADAVLTAGARKNAGGMDVLYLGYKLGDIRFFDRDPGSRWLLSGSRLAYAGNEAKLPALPLLLEQTGAKLGYGVGLDVVYGNGRYVGTMHATNGGVTVSLDGVTWSTDQSNKGNARNLTFVNGQFFLSSATGYIQRSTDGVNWTDVPPPATGNSSFVMRVLAYIGGLYIACSNGTTSTYYTSPDLVTWTARSMPVASSAIVGFARTPDYFVIRLNNSSSLHRTADGINWTAVGATAAYPTGTGQPLALVCDGSLLVGFPNSATLRPCWSEDQGVTWFAATGDIVGVCNAADYFGGLFIAGNQSRGVSYSTDGKSWKAVDPVDTSGGVGGCALGHGGAIFTAGSWAAGNTITPWRYGIYLEAPAIRVPLARRPARPYVKVAA